jgi:hypothetical protein
MMWRWEDRPMSTTRPRCSLHGDRSKAFGPSSVGAFVQTVANSR